MQTILNCISNEAAYNKSLSQCKTAISATWISRCKTAISATWMSRCKMAISVTWMSQCKTTISAILKYNTYRRLARRHPCGTYRRLAETSKWHLSPSCTGTAKSSFTNWTILRLPKQNEIFWGKVFHFHGNSKQKSLFSVHRQDWKIVQLTNETLFHEDFIHIQFIIVPVTKN